MPLIPIIIGLAGMFAGAQIDRAVDNATSAPAGGTKIPWQISLVLILIVAAVVFYGVKKVLK